MLALAIWWRGRTYDDLVRFSWVVVIFMLVGEVVRVVTCVLITQGLVIAHVVITQLFPAIHGDTA
jgi:hypothetical protein